MRISHQATRDELLRHLRSTPRSSTSELARALGVTVPTVHHLLAELPEGAVLAAGRSRRTRYALRRPLRGSLADIPFYRIDADGRADGIGNLALVQPQGSLLPLEAAGWPIPADSRDGWWDGLPYPLYDMRPQGYLGRQLARAQFRQLDVSDNPDEWNDEDIVHALSRVGTDCIGNLLLGDEAYRVWLRNKVDATDPLPEPNLAGRYAERAQQAVAAGDPVSSAAGEFPKFTATRYRDGQLTPHVLVKFSGAGGSAAERRWADLLVSEHLALACAAGIPGIDAASTRVLEYGGRVFLESERFDRVGMHGRTPVCTLGVLDGAFLGSTSSDWPGLALRLQGKGLVTAETVGAVARLWWFGQLIANADMHLGNVSFQVAPPADTRVPGPGRAAGSAGTRAPLRLAPAYDMLPMHYAPLPGGEVPPRNFSPELPLPPQRDAWQAGAVAALEFWKRAAQDVRISAVFRKTCAANATLLGTVATQV
jgi:DNA-binding transcriptional ArsR family regulator